MTKILCIESATEICSVCLSLDGEAHFLHENREGNRHSEILTILIGNCLGEAGISMCEIDAVAVSRGPGSYTSLRVGASVAKGICYALGKPLIAIDTLKSLAFGAKNQPDLAAADLFAAFIDARRMEVFGAIFDADLNEVLPGQAILIDHKTFDPFLIQNKRILLCGSGAAKCRPIFSHLNLVIIDLGCSAKFLSKLSFEIFQNKDFQDVAYFEPTYIKPPNITSPAVRT